MTTEGHSGVVTSSWLDQFRDAVERYYENPAEDAFTEWFRDQRSEGSFIDDRHAIAVILARARFEQWTPSQTAFENTKMVYHLLVKEPLSIEEVPKLKCRRFRKSEDWRRRFYEAILLCGQPPRASLTTSMLAATASAFHLLRAIQRGEYCDETKGLLCGDVSRSGHGG